MVKFDFKNKVVLVLASSKGIGFELAKEFAKNNARVIICSRSLKNLNLAKKKIKSFKIEKKIKFLKTDLSIYKNISLLHKEARKSFNTDIDILINNSGGPAPKMTIDTNKNDWDYVLNNNLKSFIFMSLKVLPGMKKKKWGRIVNLTSTTAKEPAEKMVLSNVSRAAVVAFSKTLSKEIKINGITINSILTGGVLTDRLIQLIKKSNTNVNSVLKNIAKSIPVQHIAKPSEFVNLILFLCTDEASYINGTAIQVDGGVTKTIF
jgi:3-oxoacyl-[acyl-carrier protein] reductase